MRGGRPGLSTLLSLKVLVAMEDFCLEVSIVTI